MKSPLKLGDRLIALKDKPECDAVKKGEEVTITFIYGKGQTLEVLDHKGVQWMVSAERFALAPKYLPEILFDLYENGHIVFIGDSFEIDWVAYMDVACFLLRQTPKALDDAIKKSGSLKLWVDECTAMELLRIHHRANSAPQKIAPIDHCAFLKSSLAMH